MQREIKFRAYDKRTKYIAELQGFKYVGDKSIQLFYKDEDGCSTTYTCDKEFIVLMQYTGLHDKNGKEIYEGDIVNCEKRGAAFYRSVVVYNSIMGRHDVNAMDCMFPMTLDCCEDDISIDGNDYEVIGNIYENPELEVSE